MLIFRELNDKEQQEFRKWARDNYKLGSEINSVWHPIVIKECELMNKEKRNSIAQDMFGVNYDELGSLGKWDVDDKFSTK